MKKTPFGLLGSGAVLLLSAQAQSQTVTFEPAAGFAASGPAVITENGFTLTYASIAGGFASVNDMPNGNCGPACAVNGTNVFQSFNRGSLTVTLTGGGLFSLSRFDAAQTFTTLNRSLELIVTGTGPGGPVSQTFTTGPGGADVFSTYLGTGFGNLSSLTFTGGLGYPGSEFELDNLVFGDVVGGAVPEPRSWALMIMGFGVVGGAMRYRRLATRVAFAA